MELLPPPDAAEEAAKQRKMEPVKSFRKATHQVSGDDAAEGGRSYADRASEAEMRRLEISMYQSAKSSHRKL